MLNLAIAFGVFVLALLLLRFQGKLPAKGTPNRVSYASPIGRGRVSTMAQ